MNDKQKALAQVLFSSDDTKVLLAINEIRTHGNVAFIPPLVELLINTEDASISKAILDLLIDIKDNNAMDPLIAALKDKKSVKQRAALLSVFWQSAIDASEHLEFLVELAVEGDYYTCLECLTVIENLEGPFTEEALQECHYTILEHLESNPSDKDVLLKSILELLQLPFSQY